MPETLGLELPVPKLGGGLPTLGIPKLSAGRIVAPKAGWQSVRYTDASLGGNVVYTRPPALLAVAESRGGWFTPKQFAAPKVSIALPMIELPPAVQISVPSVTVPAAAEVPPFSLPSATVQAIAIPSVSLPSVSITVPSVTIPRVGASRDDFSTRLAEIYPFNVDWGFWFANLNWMRDGLRDAIAQILLILWNTFVQPQIDRTRDGIQSAINGALSNAQSAVNAALSTSRQRIQDALNAAINDANAKIGALKDSVNAGLKTITDGANQNLERFRRNVNEAIGRIPSSVQSALNTFKTNVETGVNNAFKSNRDKLQAALDSYRVSIQDQVSAGLLQVTGYSSEALNSIVPMLWKTLGLPEQTLFVPVLFKARLDGFDFYAPVAGTVVHYAAFGT